MLCTVVVVFTLTGLCRGKSDNSLPLPLLPPPPTMSQRMSQAQVALLRRQLMHDNYDYQHTDYERRHQDVTERNVNDAARASELDQANVNSFSAELQKQDQDRQHQQGGKHDLPRRRRGPGHPHEQLGNNENRSQTEQPTKHDQPEKYDQQEPRKQQRQLQQRGQNEQLGKNKHRGPNKQPDQYKQRGQLEQRGQLKNRNQDVERGPHEQRGQNANRRQHMELGIHLERRQNDQREFGEPQEQLGQFDEQEPSMERTDRAASPLADVPPAPYDDLTERDVHEREYPPAIAHSDWSVEYYNNDKYNPKPMQRRPFGDLRGNYEEPFPRANAANGQRVQKEQVTENDALSAERELSPGELTVHDMREHEYPSARHAPHPDWAVEYYNKRHDTYDPKSMQLRSFGNLRGNYEEPFPRADAANNQRVQKEQMTEKDVLSPEQELSPEDREAFDRLERSGSENEESDFSGSQKQPDARYDEFRPQSRQYSQVTRSTRANDVHYYTPPPTRKAPPPQYDRMQNAPPYRHRDTPLGRHHSAPRDYNISKKDPLYYLDDDRLRRFSNHTRTPDVPDEDQSTGDEPLSPEITADSLHSTTGIHLNPASSQHSTVSARPSSVGIQPSNVSSRAGPIGPRVKPAGSQASPTGSRRSLVGSWASLASAHSTPPRHAGSTGPPDLLRIERARSFVVTVSPNNVTYKLLTLKSREWRRRVDRRLLEERGPEGVAIISLDRAPPPAFRLPRARRQYMHDQHHQRHKPA